MGVLTAEELSYLESKLGRKANEVEQDIVGAEWSEHCSYKSSKKYIRLLPTKGSRVLVGPGYDAGVIDIGDGHVITVHIESHNHPSAVEPFGGAATGVGGVIRDIMSMGTRPIAVLDALRFAPISGRTKASAKSKWLFKNVVKGIADYGNCIGIPTVGGEVEFDSSFEDYCLVDVASVGLGRKEQVIANQADPGDVLVLAGGSTGRDGIHGASFASKALEAENRSAVQIPDPFLEKLLLEATMEAVDAGCIKSIKDLGGGGLSCCLSETSDSLGKGFDVELSRVHAREGGMTAAELMISESQERMLYVTDPASLDRLRAILEKYEVRYSILGSVMEHSDLLVRNSGNVVAQMPSHLVAHAPLLQWPSKKPAYIEKLATIRQPPQPKDFNKTLLSLISNPTIASKRWIFQQYDHEVGIRTVVKPGSADAAVLRLDRDDKLLSVKLDGNSKHCYLDPYRGTLGCLSEGRRNVICTGAEPIGFVDHLQFASPADPEVFWTFTQAVEAIIKYCNFMKIPVVGGKVSFYNETKRGPIKPTPVIGTLGLIDGTPAISSSAPTDGDSIFLVGATLPEMGGSEYYEYVHGISGGTVPNVDLQQDMLNGNAVLRAIRKGLVTSAHDCSKGGLGVALAEMAILGGVGVKAELGTAPNACSRLDDLVFSESNSRYLIGTKEPDQLGELLAAERVPHAQVGQASGTTLKVTKGKKSIFNIPVTKLRERFLSLEKIMS
ncbi:MAG TPA: phosphoribosylformylglycinamidine synthase subunit PurL [Nitrososphaera sp.]|nr:phosphoribosylformylglycinamidine synthase subunit PurL [Nitrososphaera sp.]